MCKFSGKYLFIMFFMKNIFYKVKTNRFHMFSYFDDVKTLSLLLRLLIFNLRLIKNAGFIFLRQKRVALGGVMTTVRA